MNATERRISFMVKFAAFYLYLHYVKRFRFMITYYHRTAEQQQELFAIGRTKELHRAPVTMCDGIIRISEHQLWNAIDMVLIKNGELEWNRVPEYDTAGKIAKRFGLIFGDEILKGDIYHFQGKTE